MSQAAEDTPRMRACSSCGMYLVLAGDPEQYYVCMKCRLIELLEEKIQGLELQVETLIENRRGFEQLMEQWQAVTEGERPGAQVGAGAKASEGGPPDEEDGRWKHVTVRSRPRKRRASDGEIELRNRFEGLENEEGVKNMVADGGRPRKKRRAASPIDRGEESMEATPSLGQGRLQDGLRGTTREDRNGRSLQPGGTGDRLEDRTVPRQRQVYVIGDSILRRLDRPVTRADPENRRVCCLPGAKIRDVDLRLKRILRGAGWNIKAVSWTRDWDQTVYRSDKARFHADFEGRVRYLGDLQHNCSLRVARLHPSDRGTYRFWFYTAGNGRSDVWMGQPGQWLSISDDQCEPSLGHRMEPGPSLSCSMGATCPHHPSWYDRDGERRSPEQTLGRSGATELRISPSELDHGAALRCQVDGYRDECDSAQSQPLWAATRNVPRVEVSWPAGKAALREGDNFTLRCQAAALRPVARYVWSRGDVWLPEAGQDLRVDKAAVSDGGSYACGVWVSGPGWGYLSLSARESVEVQLTPSVWAPTYIIGPTVALVLLLLVGLVGVTAWSKMRHKRQGMSSNAPADGHGKSTAGAEFSLGPETESPYEELQGRTQDIYSQLDSLRAGSH